MNTLTFTFNFQTSMSPSLPFANVYLVTKPYSMQWCYMRWAIEMGY